MVKPEDPTQAVSLVLPPGIVKFQDAEHDVGSGIVEWTAPNMNWNPWINQPMIIEGAEEYQVSVNIKGCSHILFLHVRTVQPHNPCNNVVPHHALSAC